MAKQRSPKDLREYRRKRDFRRTPEPDSATKRGAQEGTAAERLFVVHRHAARRLHWDLRLECGGVLVSFAVPRGFVYDATVRRLAVRTEDHPLEYQTFEGVIPEGEYGAGTMTVWDRGHYRLVKESADGGDLRAAVDAGKVELFLRGVRLRGEWHLVRTNAEKDEWLLIKTRDRFEQSDDDVGLQVDYRQWKPWPNKSKLSFAKPSREVEPFDADGWWFEMEFAGKRIFLERRGPSWRVPGDRRSSAVLRETLGEDLDAMRMEQGTVDGVLVALDENERPDRALLQRCLAGKAEAELALYLFDLLELESWDLRALSLRERKRALQSVVPASGRVLFVDHVEREGKALARAVVSAGLSAVIAKRADAGYSGKKTSDWRRIPLEAEERSVRDRGVREALEEHGAAVAATRRRIPIRNREKVFFPTDGITKGDLLDYYEVIAPVLLPYLRDRPLHLHRFPDGIEGESFYQKNTAAHFPDWIRTVVLESESGKRPIRYVICNEISTLLYVVNLGSIDLHPWHSRLSSLDTPDWAVIDLDPKGAPFSQVVRIARSVGKLLDGLGLKSWLKTSGKSGLHIYLPLLPRYDIGQARMFCEAIARTIVRQHPDIATVERNVAERRGRVYVDFLQNRRGQTLVPPYVARPIAGAQVSAPLHWDELGAEEPGAFTIRTMPERVDRVGDLFAGVLHEGQDLMPAIARLEQQLQED